MPPAPRVVPFRSRAAIRRAERAAALDSLRDQILALSDEEMPFSDKADALKIVSRRRAALTDESPFGKYAMISNAQVDRVWDAIAALPGSCRPKDVDRVFKKVLVNLAIGTGEVSVSREKLAQDTGLHPGDVSKALAVLVRLGVLLREVRKVPGVRGPGFAVFSINPHVAWNGHLDTDAAVGARNRHAPPLLKLMHSSAS